MFGVFNGKVAFVTGGGLGIDEACAIALSKDGSAIAIADMDMVTAGRVVA